MLTQPLPENTRTRWHRWRESWNWGAENEKWRHKIPCNLGQHYPPHKKDLFLAFPEMTFVWVWKWGGFNGFSSRTKMAGFFFIPVHCTVCEVHWNFSLKAAAWKRWQRRDAWAPNLSLLLGSWRSGQHSRSPVGQLMDAGERRGLSLGPGLHCQNGLKCRNHKKVCLSIQGHAQRGYFWRSKLLNFGFGPHQEPCHLEIYSTWAAPSRPLWRLAGVVVQVLGSCGTKHNINRPNEF